MQPFGLHGHHFGTCTQTRNFALLGAFAHRRGHLHPLLGRSDLYKPLTGSHRRLGVPRGPTGSLYTVPRHSLVPDPKNTSRPRAARKRLFPSSKDPRRFRHIPMLPRAKLLVLSGPIGCSGTRLVTEMDRYAPETHPLHPTQQSWLPESAWDFRRTLSVVCYDFLPKE